MTVYKIWIIDDEKSLRLGISYSLKNKYQVHSYPSAEKALSHLKKDPPDLILLDIGLPGMNGIDALKEIKKTAPQVIVMMITAFEDINSVISAMKYGAHDYVLKPIHLESLKNTIRNALETIKLRKEVQTLQEKYIKENLPCIIGESDVIQDVLKIVDKVAKSPDAPVLISGESGTGKELIAQAIHYKSPIFQGPFVAVNCAAIPQNLIESELFGYEKGAFSGAHPAGRKGLIHQANGGTLFLDEIGDLTLDAQSKLLRFLENGEFYRLGGTRKQRVKTRVISATNKDLTEMIHQKLFRIDLYHRLAVVDLKIPTLDERSEDILPIARFYLMEYSQKYAKTFDRISPDTENFLRTHRWHGNIRELRNLIERGVLIGDGPELRLDQLGIHGSADLDASSNSNANGHHGFPTLPAAGIDLEALEAHYIQEAIKKSNGNDRNAAKMLNMSYYAFRYRKKKLKGNA